MYQMLFAHLQIFSEIFVNTISSFLHSVTTIILLLWVWVLFKAAIRLRRKLKDFTESTNNEDGNLDALNTKVEYRKSQFMLAIVLSELIFAIITVVTSAELLVKLVLTYLNIENHPNQTEYDSRNISSCEDNGNYHYVTGWQYTTWERISLVCFGIPLILANSLVYTLMSYYVMVTKKSLNYNISLKSVDLAREQKILLSKSCIACIILMLLIVIEPLFILYELAECIICSIQVGCIIRYRKELVCVIMWKISDVKIAFGKDHHLFKYYTKTLRKFKTFANFFIIVIAFFSVFLLIHWVRSSLFFIQSKELYQFYGICIHQYPILTNVIIHMVHILEMIPLTISYILLFLLNISTIPYLLSKFNRCPLNLSFATFSSKKQLDMPLLK
ncbi:hypothetical protein LOD99_7608 [Oopsacas minuta]|uniref:G-protein coupled receptors family 1 profile domain-containing protein n=1 Tax=Oopsacas minuta TaxID=111878 RepID=A0AAV7JPD2_9METZ|nr:hypothetical protein LOD99_7608 [Oopsacas minuta]